MPQKVKFIADIGNDFDSLDKAKELIDNLEFIDVIKVSLNKKVKELENIRKYVYEKNQLFSIAVFDIESAKEAINLKPDFIKIPSCRCNHFSLIEFVSKNFQGQIHISTGMTTRPERYNIKNRNASFVIYSCTSNYENQGKVYIEKTEGFSCHFPDIFYAQTAILNGATWIEFHVSIKSSQSIYKISAKDYSELTKWYNSNLPKLEKLKHSKPMELSENEKEARKKYWSIR